MRGIALFILKLLCSEVFSSGYFFHEPSRIELTAPDGDPDFGFSLDYQIKTNSLVVGAPRSDLDGKVFTCPLSDITNSTKRDITCRHASIDIENVAADFRKPPSGNHEYKCHLGSSLAVTDKYLFTCAPLCSKNLLLMNGSVVFGTFGTCFVHDGITARRHLGLLEKYENRIDPLPAVDSFYGGVGWTTFSDHINKIILVAKSTLKVSSITYVDMESPLQLVQEVPRLRSLHFYNIGRAFASGKFFDDGNFLYAFSMTKEKQTGAIAFLYYDKSNEKKLQVLMNRIIPILILDNDSVSMFGTALHSTDLNSDDFSELIVGAPGFSPLDGYEQGAIYLYKGGGPVKERRKPTHRIKGIKDGARFGSSIDSTDLDEDGIPEIFVSAPYQNGGSGAVHILLGYEVKQLLKGTAKDTLLSSLKHTQTLYISNFKTFGYSLHAINRNGANFLAVGSPFSGKVALYQSIPFIHVTLSLYLKGDKAVREQDTDFTVVIKITLEYQEKSLHTDINLSLYSALSGDNANIQNDTITKIKLSKEKPSELTFDVVVLLRKKGPGDYTFTANLKSDANILKQKDFDKSLVMITPHSKTEDVLNIKRHCKLDDCVPQFSPTFEWSGSSDNLYTLGSSLSESMTLNIFNEGSSTYDSCVWIKVIGVQVAFLECDQKDEDWYKCDLRIERDDAFNINIQLDMSRLTNRDRSLDIIALFFNRCASQNSNATVTKNIEIKYVLSTENIEIEGSSINRNFTYSEIQDYETSDTISIHETYKITNNASISWKGIEAVLTFQYFPFVEYYNVIDERNCKTNKSDIFIKIKCTVDIDSASTYFIHTSANLFKSKMISHFDKRKLVLNSSLELFLIPTSDTVIETHTTSIFLQKDLEFWKSESFILGVSTVVGSLIVIIVVIILFKIGFFKRKGKKKLNELKSSMKIKTVPSPQTKQKNQETETSNKTT